jgi:hypothetical protein
MASYLASSSVFSNILARVFLFATWVNSWLVEFSPLRLRPLLAIVIDYFIIWYVTHSRIMHFNGLNLWMLSDLLIFLTGVVNAAVTKVSTSQSDCLNFGSVGCVQVVQFILVMLKFYFSSFKVELAFIFSRHCEDLLM